MGDVRACICFLLAPALALDFYTSCARVFRGPMRSESTSVGKAPAAGDNPAVAARGSGATPRDAAAPKLLKYAMLYRHTLKTGALTYPIAFCLECGRVVEPIRKEYSKTGAHGKWYYAHEHELGFITLRQSNSGKRSVHRSENVPKPLFDIIYETWVFYEDSTIDEIETVVNEWLYTQKLYEKERMRG